MPTLCLILQTANCQIFEPEFLFTKLLRPIFNLYKRFILTFGTDNP